MGTKKKKKKVVLITYYSNWLISNDENVFGRDLFDHGKTTTEVF